MKQYWEEDLNTKTARVFDLEEHDLDLVKTCLSKVKERLIEMKEEYRVIRKNTRCRVTEMDDCDSCKADHYLDARLGTINDVIRELGKEEELARSINFCDKRSIIDRLEKEIKPVRESFNNEEDYTESLSKYVKIISIIRQS